VAVDCVGCSAPAKTSTALKTQRPATYSAGPARLTFSGKRAARARQRHGRAGNCNPRPSLAAPTEESDEARGEAGRSHFASTCQGSQRLSAHSSLTPRRGDCAHSAENENSRWAMKTTPDRSDKSAPRRSSKKRRESRQQRSVPGMNRSLQRPTHSVPGRTALRAPRQDQAIRRTQRRGGPAAAPKAQCGRRAAAFRNERKLHQTQRPVGRLGGKNSLSMQS